MWVDNLLSFAASQNVNPISNSNEFICTISFTYVTFAAIWTGRCHVKTVEYNRYCIHFLCSFKSNHGNYVHCEFFTKSYNLKSIRRFAHFRKVAIKFVMVVRQSARPNQITLVQFDGLKIDIWELCGENSFFAKIWLD